MLRGLVHLLRTAIGIGEGLNSVDREIMDTSQGMEIGAGMTIGMMKGQAVVVQGMRHIQRMTGRGNEIVIGRGMRTGMAMDL